MHNELKCDLSILTETWTYENSRINDVLTDFEDRTGYCFIRKDRLEGQRGGGVAVVFNKNVIQMTRARLPQSKFEVVAAVGRRTGQWKKIVAVTVYIPPWYPAERSRKALRYVNDCLIL